MIGRLLHISDLHLGHATAPQPLERLRELIPDLDPEILVVTGDLTHRGRPAELERARELLQSLGLPLLAIPGNHDIPYVLPNALHANSRGVGACLRNGTARVHL